MLRISKTNHGRSEWPYYTNELVIDVGIKGGPNRTTEILMKVTSPDIRSKEWANTLNKLTYETLASLTYLEPDKRFQCTGTWLRTVSPLALRFPSLWYWNAYEFLPFRDVATHELLGLRKGHLVKEEHAWLPNVVWVDDQARSFPWERHSLCGTETVGWRLLDIHGEDVPVEDLLWPIFPVWSNVYMDNSGRLMCVAETNGALDHWMAHGPHTLERVGKLREGWDDGVSTEDMMQFKFIDHELEAWLAAA